MSGDLLDRLEHAGRRELLVLLAASDTMPAGRTPALDAVESAIAWDLAAGF